MDEDVLIDLLDVPEEPLRWVWQGLIPVGRLTVITGQAGIGKSIMALQVASMVTQGKTRPYPIPVPDDLSGGGFPEEHVVPVPDETTTPKSAVILSDTNFVSDTLRPRLKAAGADLSKVLILNSSVGSTETVVEGDQQPTPKKFGLIEDLSRLETNLQKLKAVGREVGVIVIDPIDHYLCSGESKRQKADLITRLNDLAAKWKVAVLITTLAAAKSRDRSQATLYELLSATAQSVLTVVPDFTEPHRRMLLPVKLNLTGPQPGLLFSIVRGAVNWDHEQTWISPEEHAVQLQLNLRNPLMREEFERAPQLRRVTRWLREQLLPGRASSRWIRALAARFNVAYSTLRRAFMSLGCRSLQEKNGQFFWYIPGLQYPACQEVIKQPSEVPEGISGISREFTPENFTSWYEGKDPDRAIFPGGQQGDPHDEMPLGTSLDGMMDPFPPWV